MELKKGLSSTVINLLTEEFMEFNGYLEDSRENIEAPPEHLNLTGKIIQQEMLANGIKTREDVDKFAKIYLKPLVAPSSLSLDNIEYVKEGLKKCLVGYKGFGEPRVVDITEHTGEPGNTEALVAFIPYLGDWRKGVKFPSQEELELVFDSMGDSTEEVLVTIQNHEFMLLFNFNK